MTKHVFLTMFILVAIFVMAIPGGDAAAQNGLQCPTGYSYTVQAGDWLSTIAVRYNVPTERLALINGIADPNSIRVGQVICLTDWVVAGSVTLVPLANQAQPVLLPTVVPQYLPTTTPSESAPLLSFDDSDPRVENPDALNPGARGVWEPVHTLAALWSMVMVFLLLYSLLRGSKGDVIKAFAAVGGAFSIVFFDLPEPAGYLLTALIILSMWVLSYFKEDDHSAFGLMLFLTGMLGGFVGKFNLLGIGKAELLPFAKMAGKWSALEFSELTLSVAVYGFLSCAFLVFVWETWKESKIVGRELAQFKAPKNSTEMLIDGFYAISTLLLALLFGLAA